MTIDNFLEGKILTCEDEDDAPGDRQVAFGLDQGFAE